MTVDKNTLNLSTDELAKLDRLQLVTAALFTAINDWTVHHDDDVVVLKGDDGQEHARDKLWMIEQLTDAQPFIEAYGKLLEKGGYVPDDAAHAAAEPAVYLR